ncbi:amidohydrolase [Ornithinimicrobium sp.]|uniref:amidohydrolase n=1 Tax=Ornithinimicrobium sp. TaxID=1977084 RepID=UPI002B49B1AE|nr:amidohydrolase [Ornithinimicrobium sp.]
MIARACAAIDTMEDTLLEHRREVHRFPEVSWQEHRTTALVMTALSDTAADVRALPGSGAIADLGASDPSRRVALRADLDALPVEENTGLEWSSRHPGVAHACGHDLHTVGVLGAGLALAQMHDELVERDLAVRLLFQPAEESMPGGAHALIEAGALEGVDQLYAVHSDPSLDLGQVGLKAGPITAASDAVRVTLSGRGGHTSRPHLTADLTFALGKVITEVPAILSRRLDPRSGTALVWGSVRAGSAANVIPASGECIGTLRMLDSHTWDTTGALVEEIVHAVVRPYDVHATVSHVRGVPPVNNDNVATSLFAGAARAVLGVDAVVPTQQSLGGEDLGWYLMQVPGAMARLGTRIPGGTTYELHQGDLIVDERAVIHAAKLLAAVALA